ncbi:MAG: hypothetical protein M0Z87_12410 [Actinomycetota bacterium]|nr:hypothetical protein [Actinomycetota bacterium]
MAVNEDCRHYVMQTVRGGDRTERCRLGAAEGPVFACPEGCLFYEPRSTSQAGWAQADRPQGDRRRSGRGERP